MRKLVKALAGIAITFTVINPAPASAFTLGSLARNIGHQATVDFVSVSHRTVAPYASVLFCRQNPEECAVKRSRWSRLEVGMTEQRFNELKAINVKINRAIVPQSDDPKVAGGDVWSLAPKAGDCEDYAITKRHELIAGGWPSNALRLGITYTAFGEGHMVLVVKTTSGDLVLDNRIDAIRHWNQTGLRWAMLQSAANPAKWMTVSQMGS
jgi:predicted transglutaminase-like cysteine proteinase